MPYGDTFDSMKTYLSKLETFDDLPLKEWIRKAENSEEEFKPSPDDDKNEANRKESLQRWFSTQRFIFEKKFLLTDFETLVDG